MRILVVADETEMAALVARGLAAEGHELRTAADGVQALACCARSRPTSPCWT